MARIENKNVSGGIWRMPLDGKWNKQFAVWLSSDKCDQFEEWLTKFSAGESLSDQFRDFIDWILEHKEEINEQFLGAKMRAADEEKQKQPVDFTYHMESIRQQNHLTVSVDLSGGMNISEAVKVADALFDKSMGQRPHKVVSAKVSGQGIWNVELTWDGGHWFRAAIDSVNKTITYNHCR
jgi:hypothetical protein